MGSRKYWVDPCQDEAAAGETKQQDPDAHLLDIGISEVIVIFVLSFATVTVSAVKFPAAKADPSMQLQQGRDLLGIHNAFCEPYASTPTQTHLSCC